MSKKKNKKFKRNKSTLNADSADTSQKQALQSPAAETSVITETTAPKLEKTEEDPYELHQYDHVRKDIRKILFLLAVITVLFIGASVINSKTSALTSIGDWLYKIANIQTQ